jgi:tetratricopeptide (TPR) repeat protein
MIVGPLAVLGVIVLISFANPVPASSQPYLPKTDEEVLETLPSTVTDFGQRAIEPVARGAASSSGAPLDAQAAATRARAELRRYQASADPRYLGRAEAALGAFWTQPSPPEPILVLRARVRQSNHEFDAALKDLDQALTASPADEQALLDRASIETVVGRYEAALRDCRALEPLTAPLYSAMCRASLSGVTGAAGSAYDELSRLLTSPGLAVEDRCWVESLMGELAVRIAQNPSAERHFRSVLSACPSDTYTRGALADLLLDLGRASETTPLLAEQTNQDALLLRLVIAEKRVGAPSFEAHFKDLEQRFEEARLRGNQVHRREEARFELLLRNAPEPALSLAIANFHVQHEPADVRIALESAEAAGHPERVRDVVAFVGASRLEDPHVAELLKRLAP